MKKTYSILALFLLFAVSSFAQSSLQKMEGKCGNDIKWSYDGYTLTLTNKNPNIANAIMPDYDTKTDRAPWLKRNLQIKRVVVEPYILNIGSCAFYNCTSLQEVVFESSDLSDICWGAFLNCVRLRNISLPVSIREIGPIAFARCSQLLNVKIPERCRVGEMAFSSCESLNSVEVGMTAILGHYVFASEEKADSTLSHKFYAGEIRKLPPYVNVGNCTEYGLSKDAVGKYVELGATVSTEDYDFESSDLDKDIPRTYFTSNNTYALIIGNQNYRFVGNVPYAIHDARVFAEYCKMTLGIPVGNIHISEDATKQMILEEELEDWVANIQDREDKKLIVYYAGHGVPDVKNKNKAYILPTDVRGTNPKRGISLDDFYAKLGELNFGQTAVFLDACFSGVNRDHESVSEGLRGVEIQAEDASFGSGSVVVFSAAQGNETAQGLPEEGHGLFTYYLLKNLRDSGGNISFGTLSDNLTKQVSDRAQQLNLRKRQTPATNASAHAANNWRTMTF